MKFLQSNAITAKTKTKMKNFQLRNHFKEIYLMNYKNIVEIRIKKTKSKNKIKFSRRTKQDKNNQK